MMTRILSTRILALLDVMNPIVIDWVLEVCFHSDHMRELLWQKPPTRFVKINTDGAFSNKTISGPTGHRSNIIRTEDGSFLAAMTWQLPSVASVLMAGAEECRDGLRLLPTSPQRVKQTH
jgi:hypothetical protein